MRKINSKISDPHPPSRSHAKLACSAVSLNSFLSKRDDVFVQSLLELMVSFLKKTFDNSWWMTYFVDYGLLVFSSLKKKRLANNTQIK
jgi:hypothetical protein